MESVIHEAAPGRRAGPATGRHDARRAAMALPIELDGVRSAVLAATRAGSERPFSELELRIADLLVTQIAVALHNADSMPGSARQRCAIR